MTDMPSAAALAFMPDDQRVVEGDAGGAGDVGDRVVLRRAERRGARGGPARRRGRRGRDEDDEEEQAAAVSVTSTAMGTSAARRLVLYRAIGFLLARGYLLIALR